MTAAGLRLTLKADLAAAAGGRHLAAATAGPAGEALALLVDAGAAAAVQERDARPGRASFPRTRTRRPVGATVLRHDGVSAHRTALPDVAVAFPCLQPLPGGEVLVAGARCRRSADGTAERNARVYGADGALRREFVLGDGIQDVQCTPSGAVWVAYFDEGVYGNFGWGYPDAAPVGEAGLVRFDAHGARRWEYAPPPGLGPIDDCYALNVADDATWAYYYSDFPLVRIAPEGQIRAWPSGVAGARAVATDGQRVLFFGGYGPDALRCTLGRLGRSAVEDLHERVLVFPDGRAFDGGEVVGRGPLLHVFAGSAWYQLDVRSLS